MHDFLQPKPEVGARARRHVYDRVKWNGGLSLIGYQSALSEAGFEIRLARDMTEHLQRTYRVLGKMATSVRRAPPTLRRASGFCASPRRAKRSPPPSMTGNSAGLLVARKPERPR